jgi:choice-of-anchor B domain-containing protein
MKKLLPLVLFFSPYFLTGQPAEATFLGNWTDDNIIVTSWLNSRYNEVWGFAINCREYGVIGSTEGMHFIDVTDPTNPEQVFFVKGSDTGPDLVHRDFKSFKGYLYCIADEGFTSTLQIIDLKDLPNSVTQVYSSSEFVVRAHNLFIDTSQARLYLLGRGNTTRVLDISDPIKPKLLATYPNPALNLPYVHDAYIKDNIGIMNCGYDGLWVVDFTNPALPVLLGTMTSYPESGYNHSGWLSDDGKYYFLCDETHGKSVKVVDMSDYSNLQVVATLNPNSWAGQIPHNCLIRGDLLYVSYYYDGLQVFDVSDPFNPVKVAYYDTYPDPNENFYAGSWGVYPLLPSGNILLSDMQYGFFVFEALPGTSGRSIVPSKDDLNACTGEAIVLTLKIGEGFTSPVSLEAAGNVPGGVQFSQNPANPGTLVEVTISNPAYGDYAFAFQASDDQNGTAEVCVEAAVRDKPALPVSYLQFPADNAQEIATPVIFEWSEITDAVDYLLQISTSSQDFENNIVFSANTTEASYLFSDLDSATTYYWRVLASNNCGTEGWEPVFKFTTVMPPLATGDWKQEALSIFPNPATHVLNLVFSQTQSQEVKASLTTVTGQKVLEKTLGNAQSHSIRIGHLPAGLYLLRLISGEQAMEKKIVIKR